MADVKHFDPDATLREVVQLFWRQGAASTGIQDIVRTTGLSRSSLYATFGGKKQLYLAAVDRYLAEHALPGFARLAEDPRGLPAIEDFYGGLITARCSGDRKGWGCLVVNAHTGPESAEPEVRARLDAHHERLRAALRAALDTAKTQGQLPAAVDSSAAAEMLALLAYGVNLRSRAGASARDLRATVSVVLCSLAALTSLTAPSNR